MLHNVSVVGNGCCLEENNYWRRRNGRNVQTLEVDVAGSLSISRLFSPVAGRRRNPASLWVVMLPRERSLSR